MDWEFLCKSGQPENNKYDKMLKASVKAGAFSFECGPINIKINLEKRLILLGFCGNMEEKWRKVGRKAIKVVQSGG